jgi:hypothetical protein
MSHDAFNDRRQALEEQFFKNHEEELILKLKQGAQRATAREEVHQLTGITNEQVLQALADLNIGGGAAVLVMSLFPVIEVAWADGKIDQRERTVILELARTLGLKPDAAGFAYLSRWLDEKPEPSWHTLWADYVRELVALMKPEDCALLKHTILGRARIVAEVSGGFLGTLWRVSDAEKAVLDRLEQAFG